MFYILESCSVATIEPLETAVPQKGEAELCKEHEFIAVGRQAACATQLCSRRSDGRGNLKLVRLQSVRQLVFEEWSKDCPNSQHFLLVLDFVHSCGHKQPLLHLFAPLESKEDWDGHPTLLWLPASLSTGQALCDSSCQHKIQLQAIAQLSLLLLSSSLLSSSSPQLVALYPVTVKTFKIRL